MKIKDLGAIIKGRTPPTDVQEYWNGDIPFVTTKDLQSGKYIYSSERYISHKGLQLYPKHIIPPNAVCVSCTGNIGYVGITTKPCLTNQQILAIVSNRDNDPEFVYYLMKSMWDYFKQVEGHSTVTSQISKEKFSSIKINVPELLRQREISTTLCSFDALLEINSHKEENLRQQLKLIYNRYVSEDDKKIPLGELCDVKSGVYQFDLKDESNMASNIRWLCAQDINGTFVTNTSRTIAEESLLRSNGKQELLPPETIVTSIVGTIGQSAITTEPMCANAAIASISPKNIKIKEFIYTYLMCKHEFLNKIASGSVLKRININTLRELPVPDPNGEQIKFIVDVIRPYFVQLRHIHDENNITIQSRNKAITKLFEGALL